MNQENLYTKDSIRTVSGLYVNIIDPNPDTIIIEDIAHALTVQRRFGGHIKVHYSVAEHSLDVMNRVTLNEYKLQALMHDASEAYLLDIPSPIKQHLKGYYEIEENLMKVISQKFGFEWPMSKEVKQADKDALEWEWKYIKLGGRNANLTSRMAHDKFLFAHKVFSNGR